jgi:hypothetical protein
MGVREVTKAILSRTAYNALVADDGPKPYTHESLLRMVDRVLHDIF